MNILAALISYEEVRLAYEYRWLIFDKASKKWVVYDNNINPGKAGSNKRVVGRTKSQDQAIDWLLEGNYTPRIITKTDTTENETN